MMKNVSLMATLALVSFASSVFALQSMGDELEVQGEIVEVSTEASTITLEETLDAGEPGVVRTFLITESTKLSSEGESVELAEIHPGARATVRYVMDYGNSIATSVELVAPATD